ncbi:MAG: hypothetical protein KME09_24800 [Pleurocapsa minor HA4230-MV1]|jgi:hypothetical protein|nr:hypothetical protein [Pleurocapsa minor HA4230-MV1]
MPKKKYIVSLTVSKTKLLEQLTKKGKIAAYKMNQARILLKANINQKEGGWTDGAQLEVTSSLRRDLG